MTDADFRDLVRQMRAAQKRYFELRRRDDLLASKDYERRVDHELERGDAPDLFDR